MGSNKFPLQGPAKLEERVIDAAVVQALREDVGAGDITSQITLPVSQMITAEIVVHEDCVLSGIALASHVFSRIDKRLRFRARCHDGQCIRKGQTVASIQGSAPSIVTAERVALNFLSFMSAISTKTKTFVDAVKPYHAKIVDTRKTIPGLRYFQKYAVGVGGGYNHRIGLDTMVLIKDNHLKVMGGLLKLPVVPVGMNIEIEAQSLEEFVCFLRLKPDVIMLDNMGLSEIKKAVKLRDSFLRSQTKKILLEASGGVQERTVHAIAATGVDIISVGSLTHSVKSIDMSLDIVSGVA